MYNLLREKFIPVIDQEMNFRNVSIDVLLVDDQNIHSIRFDDPICTFGWHRFLNALLYYAFNINTKDDWRKIFRKGHFDVKKISEFTANNKQFFNLLDKERPFYQDATIDGLQLQPITLIRMIPNNDNSLFCKDFTPSMTLKELAQWIVPCCIMNVNGGRSGKMQCSSFFKSSKGGISALICGKNLFETLMFNCVPLNDIKLFPEKGDAPWFVDKFEDKFVEGKFEDNPCKGYMDYLTRPCRRIKIVLSEDGNCRQLYIGGGFKATEIDDPFCAYNKNNKPIRVGVNKPLWSSVEAFVLTGKVKDSHFLNLDKLVCFEDEEIRFRIFVVSTDGRHNKYTNGQEYEIFVPYTREKAEEVVYLSKSLYEIYCAYKNYFVEVMPGKNYELADCVLIPLSSKANEYVFPNFEQPPISHFKNLAEHLIDRQLLSCGVFRRKKDVGFRRLLEKKVKSIMEKYNATKTGGRD